MGKLSCEPKIILSGSRSETLVRSHLEEAYKDNFSVSPASERASGAIKWSFTRTALLEA